MLFGRRKNSKYSVSAAPLCVGLSLTAAPGLFICLYTSASVDPTPNPSLNTLVAIFSYYYISLLVNLWPLAPRRGDRSLDFFCDFLFFYGLKLFYCGGFIFFCFSYQGTLASAGESPPGPSAPANPYWPSLAENALGQAENARLELQLAFQQLVLRWQELHLSFEQTIGPQNVSPVGRRPFSILLWSGTGLLWHAFALDFFPLELATHDGTTLPLSFLDFHRGLPPDARLWGHTFAHGAGFFYQAWQAVYSLVCLQQCFLIEQGPPDLAKALEQVSLAHDWQSVILEADGQLMAMSQWLDIAQRTQCRLQDQYALAATKADYQKIIGDASLMEAQLLRQWQPFIAIMADRARLLSLSLYHGGLFRHSCGWFALFETANLSSQAAALYFMEPPEHSLFPAVIFSFSAFQQSLGELWQAVGLFRSSSFFFNQSLAYDSFFRLIVDEMPLYASPYLEQRINRCCFQVTFGGLPEDLLALALRDQWAYAIGELRQGSILWEFYEPRFRSFYEYQRVHLNATKAFPG